MKLPSACENVTNAEVSDETFALAGSCNGVSDIGVRVFHADR